MDVVRAGNARVASRSLLASAMSAQLVASFPFGRHSSSNLQSSCEIERRLSAPATLNFSPVLEKRRPVLRAGCVCLDRGAAACLGGVSAVVGNRAGEYVLSSRGRTLQVAVRAAEASEDGSPSCREGQTDIAGRESVVFERNSANHSHAASSTRRDRREEAPASTDRGTERRPRPQRQSSVRTKVAYFVTKRAGYAWLAGPLLATTTLFVAPAVLPVTDLFANSHVKGLVASLAMDLLFVLSADLFLVLANKAGHHQTVPGGPASWIGPWEYTGYPKGLPHVQNCLSYLGVAVAIAVLLFSVFSRTFGMAVCILVPYLALIFVQVAYERLLYNDRVPVFPLVPILFTGYRFVQLLRGAEMVYVLFGGAILAVTLRLLAAVWTLYLAMHLTQLPWLYSMWNANKAV